MPFSELLRRDSWPPTILHIRENHNPRTDTFEPTAIDENPFSYFLTPEDIDDFDNEDLSAGIESSATPKPIIREVSPSSLQRVPLPLTIEEDDDEDSPFEMPMTLKDFTAKHNSGRQSRRGNHSGVTGLGISIPENTSTRGRARVKLAPTRGVGRGRARTLSARRPQSWSMPSPDMFSIEEENEDEIQNEKAKTPEIMVTTPDQRHIYHLAPAAFEPKKKKRVHWAI